VTLALDYHFDPVPSRIRASTDNATSTIDLTITISPLGGDVAVSELEIAIGTRDNPLADAPFPAPYPDPSTSGWGYDANQDPPRLKPPVPFTKPLVYTYRDVEVDATVGPVPISVTEVQDGQPVTDSDTYAHVLYKNTPDLIESFGASPPSFSARDTAVTLSFVVAPSGQSLTYQLTSDIGWQSGVLTVDANGSGSVRSGELPWTTRFWLKAIDNSSGAPVIVQTSGLTVPLVDVPTITGGVPQITGRFATLHWITTFAASCSVYFGGHEVASGAPPDTWTNGFPLYLGLGDAPDVTVVAVGATGLQSPPLPVGTLQPDDPVRLNGAAGSGAIAVSDDGGQAFVGTNAGFTAVDLQGKTVSTLVPTGDGAPIPSCGGVAYIPGIPDSPRASPWVVTYTGQTVVFVCPHDPSKWAAGLPAAGYGSMTVYGPIAYSDLGAVLVVCATETDAASGTLGLYPLQAWGNDVQSISGGFVDVAGAAVVGRNCNCDDPNGPQTSPGAPPASMAAFAGVDFQIIGDTAGGVLLVGPKFNIGMPAGVGHGRVTVGMTGIYGVAGASDGTVATFAADVASELFPWEPHGKPVVVSGTIAAVGVAPDGSRAFVATAEGTLQSVDVVGGKVDHGTYTLGFTPAAVAVSPLWPAGPVIVTGSGGEIVLL
jgi:hypothetical protein